VLGQAIPNVVDSHAFAPTIADGAGGASSSFTLHLFNNGLEPLTINSISLAQANRGFAIENANALPMIIPPLDPDNPDPAASTRTITIRFNPGVVGAASDSIRIASDSIIDSSLVIPLSGLDVSPFGDIAISAANNNLGGLKVSGAPIANSSFATITNRGS